MTAREKRLIEALKVIASFPTAYYSQGPAVVVMNIVGYVDAVLSRERYDKQGRPRF